MIQVSLLGVQQNFDFDTKKVRSFVVFELGGKKIHAEVEDIDEVSALVKAGLNGNSSSAQVKPNSAEVNPSPLSIPPVPPEEAECVVDWGKIPDDVIPRQMKSALRALGVPTTIESNALRGLMDDIRQEFTEEDWATVETIGVDTSGAAQLFVPQQTPQGFSGIQPQPRRAQGEQPVGEITWHDGSPILPGKTARVRTVPADEYGYPIVSNAGVDPGEIVGGGDELDEDGVGQF